MIEDSVTQRPDPRPVGADNTTRIDGRGAVTDTATERAARWVPEHPQALCRNFEPKPEPAEFWCVTCGWNSPLHGDENAREAIAAELARLAARAVAS